MRPKFGVKAFGAETFNLDAKCHGVDPEVYIQNNVTQWYKCDFLKKAKM
jgi:hypothetical protein